MSTVQPYNSLGQILSRGGEIAVARSILSGLDFGELVDRFAKRFAPVRDETLEQLIGFANRMITGGDAVLSLSRDAIPPAQIIPINRELFGADSAGKRIRYVVQGEVEWSGGVFDVWIDLPDFTPWGAIEETIAERARAIAISDPGRAEKLGLDETRKIAVKQLLVERRY